MHAYVRNHIGIRNVPCGQTVGCVFCVATNADKAFTYLLTHNINSYFMLVLNRKSLLTHTRSVGRAESIVPMNFDFSGLRIPKV